MERMIVWKSKKMLALAILSFASYLAISGVHDAHATTFDEHEYTGATATSSPAPSETMTVVGNLASSTTGETYSGALDLEVKIYGVPSGGTAAWSECWSSLNVSGGNISLALGTNSLFANTTSGSLAQFLIDNPSVYLEFQVCDSGSTCGGSNPTAHCDTALSPRMAIGSVPYAGTASRAESLQGLGKAGFIQADSTVTQGNLDKLTAGGDASALHNHDSLYAKTGSSSNVSFGSVSLSANPITALQACTKGYVDTAIGGLITGVSSFNTRAGAITLTQADVTTALGMASGTNNGYLTSSDWTAFNNKQPAGNYITAITGDVTVSGFSNGSVSATLPTIASSGTYSKVTVNAKGQVTSGSSPTTLSGYGITDAAPIDNPQFTGNVGIGTTAPPIAALDVNGAIRAGSIMYHDGTSTTSANDQIANPTPSTTASSECTISEPQGRGTGQKTIYVLSSQCSKVYLPSIQSTRTGNIINLVSYQSYQMVAASGNNIGHGTTSSVSANWIVSLISDGNSTWYATHSPLMPIKKVFPGSGNSTFTVPIGVSNLSFKIWGAGGAGYSSGTGGAGGYTSGTIPNAGNKTLDITVGGGGTTTTGGGFGGGGSGGSSGAGGGGASWISYHNDSLTPFAVAGGGGGGNTNGAGGAGGGLFGNSGGGEATQMAYGGSQSSGGNGYGGTNGGSFAGGSTTGGGSGGGGGYYGGGGASSGYGGGGGSGYFSSDVISGNTISGTGSSAPNSQDADYTTAVGMGGNNGGSGGNGLVVLSYY